MGAVLLWLPTQGCFIASRLTGSGLIAVCVCGVLALDLFPTFVWAQSPSMVSTARAVPLQETENRRIEMSLADAVAIGLRDNRTISGAHLQRAAQKFDLLVAEGQFLPKLTLRSSYLARQDGGASGGGASADISPAVSLTTSIGTQLTLSWYGTAGQSVSGNMATFSGPSFSLSQPLLRGAGLSAATAPLRAVELEEAINQMSLQATVSQVVTEIVLAYRSYMLTAERLRISQDALGRARDLMSINQHLVDSGRMAAVDLIQNESDVANQELAVEEAANAKEAARLALLEKLAIEPRADPMLTERLDVVAPQVSLGESLEKALSIQPDYLSKKVALERAKLGVDIAMEQRQWDMSLIAGIARNSALATGIKAGWSRYGGVQLIVPLGDVSLDRPIVQADVALRTARLQLEGARQQLDQQVRDAVRTVETRWRQVTISRRAVELAAQKLEVEREKLKAGRSSNFQVLSFENDYRQTLSSQLSAVIDYMNALTLLDRQVGDTLQKWEISLRD